MDRGPTVSLFTVDLGRAVAAWRDAARDALPAAQARLGFDALVEQHAAARLFDAPLAALADVFSALARATRTRALELELNTLEDAPSAYPPELRAAREAGGLRLWPSSPQQLRGVGAALAAATPPRSVDAALWADLVDAVTELLETATRPGMAVVGALTA